jgi:predicted DNA-binding transcriptional regulator YafY
MPHPTVRVLAVLELLQSHGLISGAELARRVAVDGRTLRRYIAMLKEMGIPITTQQGRCGGYRLVPGFKLPPMMFTDEEAQALSLGLIAARGLGLADSAPAIERVQAKLDRVLPSAPRKTIAALRESVALQTGDAGVKADTNLLRVLSESAQARRTAALRYRAADGALTSREFDVYGLVFRTGRWYVVGFCQLRSGLRTLRLDRIAHADILERAFERPAGFDASDYLTRAMATLPRAIPVEVFLHTDLASARRELPNALGVAEASGKGVVLKGSADELDGYARELMRLPFRVQVREPAALGGTLARLARELVQQFAQAAEGPAPRSGHRVPIAMSERALD